MRTAENIEQLPQTNPSADAATMNIDDIDVSRPEIYESYVHHQFFDRLRKDDPVHLYENEEFGRFWSVTKYKDIMAVDTNHKVFSSEPTFFISETAAEFSPESFINMDQPKHDVQRNAVIPAVAAPRVAEMESLIRERIGTCLDSLPIGETFNWVDKVSIEISTQMLATLFDFPFEDRRKLTRWSDITTTPPELLGLTIEEARAELLECLETFGKMWTEREAAAPRNDFISLMAHNPDTKDLEPMQRLGNLMLLIAGGNDTTRNSMSASVLLMDENPHELAKVKANQNLIGNMVSEVIRYQTPLAYMRRTALEDVELGGKKIKKGDKVVMWYVSGNRDEEKFDNPNEFIVDRKNARNHMSFGFGIHRCMGNRIGEMQVRILWEEILKRFEKIEVVDAPVRIKSQFIMGIADLNVRLHPLVKN